MSEEKKVGENNGQLRTQAHLDQNDFKNIAYFMTLNFEPMKLMAEYNLIYGQFIFEQNHENINCSSIDGV